jgi:hypothetical protein
VFAKRRDVVVGAVDPCTAPAAGSPKGIPGFWLRAMQNCSSVRDFIEEHDEPVLEYLTDVTTSFIADCKGFKLEFHFAPNPYIEDAVLTKTFHIPNFVVQAEDDEDEDGEDDVRHCCGRCAQPRRSSNADPRAPPATAPPSLLRPPPAAGGRERF